MPLYLTRISALAAALAWMGAFAAYACDGLQYVIAATMLTLILIKSAGSAGLRWFLIVVPALFYLHAHEQKPVPSAFDLSRQTGSFTIFQAELLEIIAQPQFQRTLLVVRPTKLIYPHDAPLSGKAEVVVKGSGSDMPKLSPGNYLEIKAHIIEPEEPSEPWRYKQKTRLAQNAIFCLAITHGAALSVFSQPCTSKAAIETWIASGRASITNLHVSTLGTTYGPLLESIVLGNRCVELPSDLVEEYRKVGLSHLLAASGFNLTIIILVTHFVVKALTRSRAICALVTLLPIATFVALAGLSPSVVRAAACCLLVLLAIQSGRALNATAVLSIVLFMVLVMDPSACIDVGAQLSYAATFGILQGARPLAAIFLTPLAQAKQDTANKDRKTIVFSANSIKRALIIFLSWTLEAVAVVLSAQAAVLPIQLSYFWRLGTMFLPASVLVDPLVAPITIIGFASSSLILVQSTFGGFCRQLDLLAFVPLKALDAIASYFAQIEGTYLNFGPPAAISVVIYYTALTLFCLALISGQRRALTLAFLMLSLVALIWRPNLPQPIIWVGRNSLVVLSSDRRAIVFGDDNAAGKFLAYCGARLTETRDLDKEGNAGQPRSFSLKAGAQTLKIILIFNTHPLKTHRKQSSVSATERLPQRSCNADYVLLIQRGRAFHRNNTAQAQAKPHDPQTDGLALAIFCERGMQAQLIRCESVPLAASKRLVSTSETQSARTTK